MSKKNLEKKWALDNEGVWSVIPIVLLVLFLVHYSLIAPSLSENTGNNNNLIIVLSILLGAASSILTVVALIILKQKRKLLTIFGFIASIAFFLYAFVAATFVITF